MMTDRSHRKQNRAYSILFLFTLIVSFAACRNDIEPLSALHVVGGRDAAAHEYPSVVGLIFRFSGYKDNFEFSTCTGTFIREDVVLTAAHCFVPSREAKQIKLIDVTVFGDERSRKTPLVSTGGAIHPDYNGQAESDLGLVFFPAASAPAVAKLGSRPGKNGDKVHFVGMGVSRWEASWYSIGTKRIGTNVIGSADGMIAITNNFSSPYDVPEPGRSAYSNGDSGGPLFNDQEEIIGVNSMSLVQWTQDPRYYGGLRQYVRYVQMQVPNVTQTKNESFINSTLAEMPINQNQPAPSESGGWCTFGFKACFTFCRPTDGASPTAPGFGKAKIPGYSDQWCRITNAATVANNFKTKIETLPKAVWPKDL